MIRSNRTSREPTAVVPAVVPAVVVAVVVAADIAEYINVVGKLSSRLPVLTPQQQLDPGSHLGLAELLAESGRLHQFEKL